MNQGIMNDISNVNINFRTRSRNVNIHFTSVSLNVLNLNKHLLTDYLLDLSAEGIYEPCHEKINVLHMRS